MKYDIDCLVILTRGGQVGCIQWLVSLNLILYCFLYWQIYNEWNVIAETAVFPVHLPVGCVCRTET